MGAGKSAVGRALANRLGRPFLDADQELERRLGVDLARVFELEGEAGFRRRERDLLAELTLQPGVVLATGGGAVLDADNRRLLGSRGRVVFLAASVATQVRRARHTAHRPLLRDTDPAARLGELYALREPLYRDLADLVVETDDRSPSEIVATIVAGLPDA